MRSHALIAVISAAFLALSGCEGASEAPVADAPQSRAEAEAAPDLPTMGEEVRIMALGDSLFTGYGLGEGESYPALLEAALRARGINARIVNAGVSGDTSGAGADRLAFALDAQPSPPQLVIISLGGNDMLRAIPPQQTRANLDRILAELDKRGIDALLLGMLAAPNLGETYEREFNTIYPSLARKYDAELVPFFLQSVIDKPDLIQADRIHPTKEGLQAMVSDTVDEVAEALQPSR